VPAATLAPTPAPRGGLLVLCSSLLFAAMALFAKAASETLSGTEVAFVRSAFGLLVCGLVATRRPFVARNRSGLFWRGLSGAIAVYLYFVAIAHLPVGIATLLNYTAPVFTAIWSVIVFGERLDRRSLFALGLTTLGIGFVLRGQAGPGALGVGVYELIGLCGAIISGLSMALIADLRRTDGAWEIFLAFSLGCLLITAPQALAGWRAPSPRAWALLVGMGLFSVSAQLVMTYAMRYVTATLSGVINQMTPIASLLFGWLVFGERFGLLTSVGITLTLLGGSLGAYLASSGRRHARVEPGPTRT